MAFQPVPDTAEFRLIYTYANTIDVQSTVYFRLTAGAWTSAALGVAAGDVAQWWLADVAAQVHTAFTLVEVRARDLDVASGAEFVEASGQAGLRAGLVAPLQCAAVVQLKAEGAGDPKRGWIFHPGALETDLNDVSLVAGFRASVDAAYSTLEAAVIAGTPLAELVIVSRYDGTSLVNKPNGEIIKEPTLRAAAATNRVTTIDVRSLIGSQRDRRS